MRESEGREASGSSSHQSTTTLGLYRSVIGKKELGFIFLEPKSVHEEYYKEESNFEYTRTIADNSKVHEYFNTKNSANESNGEILDEFITPEVTTDHDSKFLKLKSILGHAKAI